MFTHLHHLININLRMYAKEIGFNDDREEIRVSKRHVDI